MLCPLSWRTHAARSEKEEKQVNIRVRGSWWLAYPRAKERGGEKRSSQYKSQRELVQVRYRRLRVVLGFERNGPLYIVIVVGLSGRHLLLPGWGSTLCLESSPSKARPSGRGQSTISTIVMPVWVWS
jgi:hypothetical protein